MLALLRPVPSSTPTLPPANGPQRQLFGIAIDALTMTQAVQRVLAWVDQPSTTCQMVVTPNLDHVVQLQSHAGLQQAYRQAGLVLADGWPVVSAARWLNQPLPERVPGSDLVPAILATAHERTLQHGDSERRLRVYLLGAGPGVADRAAARIEQQWPGVQVVGTYSPPLGFEKSSEENQKILQQIAVAQPQILVVGLGAPKQELWVAAHQTQIAANVALCVGATIDFLAGEKRRAPRWLQAIGLEWLHRMLSEPRRLVKRYWHDAWAFPPLLWREFRRRSTASHVDPTSAG